MSQLLQYPINRSDQSIDEALGGRGDTKSKMNVSKLDLILDHLHQELEEKDTRVAYIR